MDENTVIEVIVGTYEDILIGYRVVHADNAYSLEQSFTNHSHSGCIRVVAVSGRYLASGSADETVKLFDLKNRSEVGSLFQQEGTITSLRFYQNGHLFSSSEDGSICIWKPGNWICLRTLRGHKDSVTALCIHPSGKLALSSSKDKTLKTWNLIKGRIAFTTNIRAVGDLIEFSPNGSLYAVVIGHRVDVYSMETAGVVHSIDFARKVNNLIYLTENILVLGGEGENIEFHAANKKAIICVLSTNMTRIKGLNCIPSPDGKNHWLIASSSNGIIKIWTLDIANLNEKPILLTQINAGCRITCQTVSCQQINPQENVNENSSCLESKELDDQEHTQPVKRKKSNLGSSTLKKKRVDDT